MKIYCFRCKGTTKNANTQIFLEKNVFLYKKSAYLLHLANVASGELLKNVWEQHIFLQGGVRRYCCFDK